MLDTEFRRMLMDDRIDTLRHAASRPVRTVVGRHAAPTSEIELRLCKASDDPALERLAALSEQPVPFGRLVVALCDGEIVAAMPLAGGHVLRDPFVRTEHLLPLLSLRVEQLRQPAPKTPLVPRLLRRHA